MLRYNDKPWMSIRIKQLVKNRQLAVTQGDLVKWRLLRNKIALFTQQGTTTNNQSQNQFLQELNL